MIKKIVNWILIILGACLIVALGIFGSSIYFTIYMIGKGLGLILLIAAVIYMMIEFQRAKKWK